MGISWCNQMLFTLFGITQNKHCLHKVSAITVPLLSASAKGKSSPLQSAAEKGAYVWHIPLTFADPAQLDAGNSTMVWIYGNHSGKSVRLGIFDYGSSDHWGHWRHPDFKWNTQSRIDEYRCWVQNDRTPCPTFWLGALGAMMSHVCWYL